MTESQEFADTAGRYRLDSRIATGGMGEVWRATDTALGREVAVKLLKTEFADDPVFRSRFETEARHAAALHHPGVAAVYDVGERDATDGSGQPRPFLVMELVEGQPLSALIGPDRDLDPAAVRDLLAQVGDALGAAHTAGIVHRDVKPANLIVTPAGRVKVTDFGIARAADGVGITRTGAVMGTPQYLSPEQAEGRPATAASDVYALGVVAFECLVGRRPFDAESPVATALAHIREPVPALPARVPSDLAAVVTRALSKDPSERYADGSAFAAALRDPATAAVPRPAVVPPVVAPSADDSRTQVLAATPYEPAAAAVPPTASTAVVDDDRRTNPWPIVAVVLMLVALAIVLTLLLTGGDDDDTDPTPDRSTTAASTRPTPTETTPTTTAPESVTVDEGLYIGQDVDEVEAELTSLGLRVQRNPQDNADASRDNLVTGVSPSGDVEPDTIIVLTYWDVAPEEPTEEPEPEPTSEPPPSEPTTEPTQTTPPPTDPVTPPTEGVPTP